MVPSSQFSSSNMQKFEVTAVMLPPFTFRNKTLLPPKYRQVIRDICTYYFYNPNTTPNFSETKEPANTESAVLLIYSSSKRNYHKEFSDVTEYNRKLLEIYVAFQFLDATVVRAIEVIRAHHFDQPSDTVFKKLCWTARAITKLHKMLGDSILPLFRNSYQILSVNAKTANEIVEFIQRVVENKYVLLPDIVKGDEIDQDNETDEDNELDQQLQSDEMKNIKLEATPIKLEEFK